MNDIKWTLAFASFSWRSFCGSGSSGGSSKKRDQSLRCATSSTSFRKGKVWRDRSYSLLIVLIVVSFRLSTNGLKGTPLITFSASSDCNCKIPRG